MFTFHFTKLPNFSGIIVVDHPLFRMSNGWYPASEVEVKACIC